MGSFINIRVNPCVSLAEAENFLLFLVLIEMSLEFDVLAMFFFLFFRGWNFMLDKFGLPVPPCHSQREKESWEAGGPSPESLLW